MKISGNTFDRQYNQIICDFAETVYLSTRNWSEGGPWVTAKRRQFMLFLYGYALTGWEQDKFGNYEHKSNFLTDKQVGKIIERAKQL